jgi:hypothetical protein
MALDYFATDRQAHTGPRYLPAVETLKKAENRSLVLRPNTNAVVAHTEDSLMFVLPSAYLHTRYCFGAVLNRITDKVLEDLYHLPVVA